MQLVKLIGLVMLCIILNIAHTYCQQLAKPIGIDTTKIQTNKPEIFSSGFIDVLNNGQVNASARFIKLFIGEPGKFFIPLSFYGGVSNNTFQNNSAATSTGQTTKSNDHLVNQYINPLSGLVNVNIEGIAFRKKSINKITKLGYIYQVGERVLNGIRIGPISNPLTGKPTNFLNTFATAGLYFETGAWEKTNAKNVGIFWLIARYHICKSDAKQIQAFIPNVKTNGLYYGYSMGFGVEINNLVNIKAIYYKYNKPPEIDYGLPIYQFTFNYTVGKK